MTIGERLNELKLAHGIDTVELARRSGLSRTCVSEAARGTYSPTLRTLTRLAGAFGLSVRQFLPDDSEPAPEPYIVTEDDGDLEGA